METSKAVKVWIGTTALSFTLVLGGICVSSSQAQAAKQDSANLDKVAGILFETEQSLFDVQEELSRVNLSRAARRVKAERLKELMAKKDALENRLRQARSIFGKLAKTQVFSDNSPMHTGGSFKLTGSKGAVACHSSDSGASGQCVIDSENISFHW